MYTVQCWFANCQYTRRRNQLCCLFTFTSVQFSPSISTRQRCRQRPPEWPFSFNIHHVHKLDGWSNTTVFLVLGTVVSGKVPVCLGKVASTPHLHHDYTGTMPETTFSSGRGHRWRTKRGMLVFSLIKWIGLWCQPCLGLSWGPSCENTISLTNNKKNGNKNGEAAV